MAKNWTMAEATKAVAENDMVAIADLGKRFPLMMHLLDKSIAGDGEAVVELFGAIPEYLTANKVNTAIKNIVGDGEVEDEDETEEKPVKKAEKKSAKKVADDDVDDEDESEAEDDYDSMTGNQLVALCKERGIWSTLKDKKKAGMIAGLRAADEAGDDADEVEDEETEDGYAGMSVQELYKECKKRGIKAEIKKPAKYYIGLLEKDDAAADEDEDDWGEEEEETPAPKKSAKKADKKSAKKAAKEDEEDDDDDWDI